MNLREAFKEVEVAEAQRELCVKAYYPVGCRVRYKHGSHFRNAIVTGHGFGGDDLIVTKMNNVGRFRISANPDYTEKVSA